MNPTSTRPPGATAASTSTVDGLTVPVLLVLGSLTAVAPLVTDLYLPALPDLARSLGTSDAMAQLTVTISLVGLALGQLVAGPLSDRVGRMIPLRVGVVLLILSSVCCAMAGNIGTLLAFRLAQGLAGAAVMVVARAIVRDLADGARAAKAYSDLMLVMGLAPVVGPMLGGQMLRFTDWRGIFVSLAVLCTAILLATWWVLDETGDRSKHAADAPRPRAFRTLLGDRTFRAYLVVAALLGVVLFTYISMSSFVLRQSYGLGPVAFSWVFGANALGLITGSQVNARLVRRQGPGRMLRVGLALLATATTALAAALALQAPLPWVLAPLWFVLCGVGCSMGNAMALALMPYGRVAGAASALMGTCQFLFGAGVAPLASIGGASGTAMGAVMAVAGVTALGTGVLVTGPWRSPAAEDH